jgi:hypothetical protein
MVETALAQLATNAQFEGSRLKDALDVAQLLRGDIRGATAKALANRPDLWEYSPDSVGKVVTRKNFEDPVPISTLVIDPTKNQLTPEQLKEFSSITSLGGMAIDPITGFEVMIDTQGRYVLGSQPTGDWLRPGQDYSKYQPSYTQPNYQPLYLGGRPDSLGTDDMGTGGTGGMGGTGNVVSQINNADGSKTVTYKNGTTETFPPGIDIPGTPTGPTLAVNTFKNTLALFFGASEMKKPWVDELYRLVNPYYKSGSSIDEALNLAIQEGRNNPNLKDFTSRFKGIYDLQEKLLKGVAITVPTIAEFIATEAKMGDVLNQAGLSSLNQQSYLGDIIGKGVNVTEFTNRINNVFLRIDQLPQQAKDFISGSFPTLDKTQLAKAILGGDKGAIELSKELGGLEVQAAFKAQGLGVDTATGLDIASRGFGYQETLTGAGTVAQSLPTYEKLQEISSGKDIKTEQAQKELQGIVFNKSIVDSMKAEQLASQEIARFRSSSGIAGSKSLASQQRGAGLI